MRRRMGCDLACSESHIWAVRRFSLQSSDRGWCDYLGGHTRRPIRADPHGQPCRPVRALRGIGTCEAAHDISEHVSSRQPLGIQASGASGVRLVRDV